MMIELLLAGHLCNFLKAKIIGVSLCERKRNIHEVLSQPRYIRHASFGGNGNHRFGRVDRYLASVLKRINEMPEKFDRVFALSMKEVIKHVIATRMRLIIPDKFLFAVRARPHGVCNSDFKVLLFCEMRSDNNSLILSAGF